MSKIVASAIKGFVVARLAGTELRAHHITNAIEEVHRYEFWTGAFWAYNAPDKAARYATEDIAMAVRHLIKDTSHIPDSVAIYELE